MRFSSFPGYLDEVYVGTSVLSLVSCLSVRAIVRGRGVCASYCTITVVLLPQRIYQDIPQ